MTTQRAATETEAANGALAHCKQPPIASIDERRAVAIACRTRFGGTRDALLRDYPWNFATAYVTPALDPRPARGPFRNRYPLPADCVRVRGVAGLEQDEWAVEASSIDPGEDAAVASVLVTNATAPNIEYTRRIINVALWDALFLEVFELRLGAKIAPLVGRNSGLAAELDARAAAMMKPARKADAQEKARTEISRDTSWLRARRGWRS